MKFTFHKESEEEEGDPLVDQVDLVDTPTLNIDHLWTEKTVDHPLKEINTEDHQLKEINIDHPSKENWEKSLVTATAAHACARKFWPAGPPGLQKITVF